MDHRLLGIYLNDHRAGAAAGIATARRCRNSNEGTDLGRFLTDMIDELDVDIALLDDVRHAIGAHPAVVKRAVASLGAHLGRAKLNGRLTSYSPLSRVLELDLLSAGVHSKLTMWRALDLLSADHPALDSFDFTQPIRRGERQLERLRDFHREAARDAF